MTLFRQLWLAVIASTLLAFAGSLVVSMLTARHYLEEQLASKNRDNAASLALSMSQLPKDAVTIELQVAALFDSGQYAAIRVLDPDGHPIVEKQAAPMASEVPAWFSRLFPIESREGQAQVSSGWRQFASIHLTSHNRFAYAELWAGGLRLIAWFVVGGLLMGMLGMRLLKRVQQPLQAVVEQANAITERRFTTIGVPHTPELHSLASAMNGMVTRLKGMFDEEAARLEQVRREATQDPLSGLANRAYFMNQLNVALSADDAAPNGTLIILRLADLAGINKRAGREAADEVIQRIGKLFNHLAQDTAGASAARLNGADFALLQPNVRDVVRHAEAILSTLRDLVAAGVLPSDKTGHVASATYHHGESIGHLLARLDAALASAEAIGPLGWHTGDQASQLPANSSAEWKSMLQAAIRARRLRLIDFPVADADGKVIHMECPLRLQASEDGEWLAAGSFMPMASRLSMTAELDYAAVAMALERIAGGVAAVAVNLSGESILDRDFIERLCTLVGEQKDLAPRLWLEVSEIGAFQHYDAFRNFCNALRPFGCRLGIEHFGRQFSEIGRLHDIGLDYVKVDGSFIRDIHLHPGNQTFLRGLCAIAHNMGFKVIAEGVRGPDELAILPQLAFDGATGPGVA